MVLCKVGKYGYASVFMRQILLYEKLWISYVYILLSLREDVDALPLTPGQPIRERYGRLFVCLFLLLKHYGVSCTSLSESMWWKQIGNHAGKDLITYWENTVYCECSLFVSRVKWPTQKLGAFYPPHIKLKDTSGKNSLIPKVWHLNTRWHNTVTYGDKPQLTSCGFAFHNYTQFFWCIYLLNLFFHFTK